MDVTYFSQRKTGPEAKIEDIVARQISELFPYPEYPSWTAGSLPVGAGMPDLTIVYGNPQVYALTKNDLSDAHILAYLRAVGRARLETIALRVKRSEEIVFRQLRNLIEAEVVRDVSQNFSLIPECKDILPEIVTIEVKVSNWRKALQQAHRNSIFAHRSFVALPIRVAQRAQTDPDIAKLGVGILAVTEDEQVQVLRRGRRHHPRVWAYYYQLALQAARHLALKEEEK